MRTFNKQAASLKKNLKQNNLMPLFVVFSVIVMLSLTYKSVSKVNGVGNTMFKEGNRNRRRRVRQGFREGNDDDDDEDGEAEQFGDKEAMGHKKLETLSPAEAAPEGFLNGGGIGRKAGFVGREGMTANMRNQHQKEHQRNTILQRVIYNANNNQGKVGKKVLKGSKASKASKASKGSKGSRRGRR